MPIGNLRILAAAHGLDPILFPRRSFRKRDSSQPAFTRHAGSQATSW